MITSLERVLRALQGKKQERPPFTLTLSLYGARLTGCPLKEYFKSPQNYCEGQLKILEEFSPDILFAPFVLTYEAEAFGSELHFSKNYAPNIKKPAVARASSFFTLRVPDVDTHESLFFIRESIRLLSKACKNRVPVCAILTAPIDLPALILGIDQWIETLVTDPSLASEILNVTGKHFISLANAFFSDGASFIGIPSIFTNPQFMYKQMIGEQILPVLSRAFADVKGPLVFHHGGNPLLPSLPDFTALPNIAAFAFDPRDSLAEARTILGPARLILGNLNGPTLARTETAEVLETARKILKDRKEDPCYIFASSGADIPYETPPERIKALSNLLINPG